MCKPCHWTTKASLSKENTPPWPWSTAPYPWVSNSPHPHIGRSPNQNKTDRLRHVLPIHSPSEFLFILFWDCSDSTGRWRIVLLERNVFQQYVMISLRQAGWLHLLIGANLPNLWASCIIFHITHRLKCIIPARNALLRSKCTQM